MTKTTRGPPLDPYHELVFLSQSSGPTFTEDGTCSQSVKPIFKEEVTCTSQRISMQLCPKLYCVQRTELIITRKSCAVLKYA